MKLFLEIPDMESGGQLLVFIVEMYKVIEMFLKPLKEGFAQIKKMRTFTSEIVNLKETFLDSNKSHIKMIEEVSPEISKILVKLDKPVSLLELGLERVQGLVLIQQWDSMEQQLPVTLKTQVSNVNRAQFEPSSP